MKKEVSPVALIAVGVVALIVVAFLLYRMMVTPSVPASAIKSPPPPGGQFPRPNR